MRSVRAAIDDGLGRGFTFGLTAVFIGAAVIHLCLLPSRLILTNEFMAQVEAHAAENVTAETGAAETVVAEAER